MSEARAGKRFPLQLPIRVAGTDGFTRNVSAAGIYLNADTSLAVGTELEFDLILPADIVGGNSDVHVMCSGHVVRVEPRGGTSAGLACVIDYYKMVRTDSDKTC